ncbi:MAG: oligosaccharide flippase family protein [Chloroflexi bacterium]|nr:oligosaccharide flippase family protein [Chloroflexota bacterium]
MSGPMPFAEKVLRNALYSSVGRLWLYVITFVLTPYILNILGAERFGLWALTFAVTSYFSLMDLGVSESFIKFVAEHHTRHEPDEINRVVTTGLVFYVAVATIIAVLGFAAAPWLISLFRISPELESEALFVLRGAFFVICFANAMNVFQGVVSGLQRMDVSNLSIFAVSFQYGTGVLLVLRLGYGLKGLIINQIIMMALNCLLLFLASFRLLPTLSLRPRFFGLATLRKLLSYGLKVQAGRVAYLIGGQVDRLLIGYFLPLTTLALYDIAGRLVSGVKTIPLLPAIALIPAASELDARADLASLRSFHRRSAKYLVLLAAPLVFFTFFAATPILLLWVGPGYDPAVWVIRALLVGNFVHLLTAVGTSVARGMGKPGMEMRYSIVVVVIDVLLGVLLIGNFGFVGVLLATPISLIVGSLYFLAMFHRAIGEALPGFVREVLGLPMIASWLAGAAIYMAYRLLGVEGGALNRLEALVAVVGGGVSFAVVYFAVIWISKYLDETDWRVVTRLFQLVNPRYLLARGR